MTLQSALLNQALDSFITYSTDIIKLPNILYTLPILIYTFMCFHYKQIGSVSLVLRPGHFGVAKISFFIKTPCQF
jgi:hypothetical protein